jgi:mannose-6-phosphate isomerase-like protein (cupin superfamily)
MMTDPGLDPTQLDIDFRGEVEITVDSSRTVLRLGDGYVIPAQARHRFRVLSADGFEYVEVFLPPKEGNR